MDRQELEALEKACEAMTSKAMRAFFLTVPMPLAAGFWMDSVGAWAFAALLPLLVNLVVFERLSRRFSMLSAKVDAAINMQYAGTEWVTPAGARGIVVEALSRGRRLKLAFPSGVVATYQRRTLSPVEGAGEAMAQPTEAASAP